MLNSEDIQWFVIHTRPHQESKVRQMLETEQDKRPNILDVYCPSCKNIKMQKGKNIEEKPLFAARVFVQTTQKDATLFLTEKYPEGYLEYDKTQKKVMTIPELQMLFFIDFNEHYPEQALVLERPYSDYAFNAKNNEPNETIRVMDGPFAGKTGYLIRFRRERRLVFQMEDMAVSIPDVWDYHLTRLHNIHGDKQSKNTQKNRAIDFIVGMLQGCGFGKELSSVFRWLIKSLAERPSLNQIRQHIQNEHSTEDAYRKLEEKLSHLTQAEASAIISLATYANEHPEIADHCSTMSLRPFLTPTSGVATQEGKDYSILLHDKFAEYIRPITFMEATFFPEADRSKEITVRYYAHIGIIQKSNGNVIVFANWNEILKEYFYLVGDAKNKQLDTFSKYCPLLYKILMGQEPVKAEKDLLLDNGRIHALSIHVRLDQPPAPHIWEQPEVESAIQQLTNTCQKVCLEINTSTHLASWRKYLRSIWLHN